MKKILLFAVILSFCFSGIASASTDSWCYEFKKDISFGEKGADVEALKSALIKEGLYKEEWSSDSFDAYVTAAVMGFQNKYKSEILKPIGLTNPTGTVSTMTLKKLNSLFKCGVIKEDKGNEFDNLSEKDKVIKAAVDYIKKYLAVGVDVVVNKTDEDVKSFYRFEAKAGDMIVPTYISTDGKIMIFQETDITKEPQVATQQTVNEVQKSEKPKVELFVMSQCPYGTQIEKGIIPAIEALGDKIDFELKFCSYSMHGEEELKEQLNQYCIQKEQKDKLLPYLKCFLKQGNSKECIASVSIDSVKLNACVDQTDKKFKVTENYKNNIGYVGGLPGFDIYKDDNEKYGVQGSPTLVINGSQVQSYRDSNSLLKTICSAFSNTPDSCNMTLSTDTPTSGFGDGTAQQGAAGSCQ